MKKYFKIILLYSIIVFVISSLIHSFYEMLPNGVTLIFFPVNESIWEHMKMIFSSYVLFTIGKTILFNKKTILLDILTAYTNIIVFLILYLPIYYIFKENMIVTLSIYFISIVISFIIRFIVKKKLKVSEKIDNLSFILIIVTYILFTYLTYYPINADIFIDHVNKKIGVYKIR